MKGQRLRIAQLAPIAMAVGAREGDSIEQLVSLLTEELVRRGHDVTLFATGDSETSASLRSRYPRGYEHDGSLWDWRFHETMHAAWALEHAAEFDLVHSHAYHFALPFTRFVLTPVVHTYHVEPSPEVVRAFGRYPEANLVAVSRFQRGCFRQLDSVPVIHHGIDTGAFRFVAERGEYLLFLGRMLPDKGPLDAIRAARELELPLVLAGPAGEHFHADVDPFVDGRRVVYAGRVGGRKRNELLAGAAALLYPIRYPEPFGLVLVEAMACGTPVAAVGIGAVPELVDEGVTGSCASSAEQLAGAVRAALALDRARVRATAVARFDYRRMVDDYEQLYRRVVWERGSSAA
jgi:glycosyltransferase involved in cell wall biosynthesis